MIYSKTCEYAIRAISYLATKPKGVLTMVPEISENAGVPPAYLAKVFQNLVKHDILTSRRGPDGGFAIKKDPKDLSLFQIVQAVDDISRMEQCVMGFSDCSSESACPMHSVWTLSKEKMRQEFESCSLEQFMMKTQNRSYRRHSRSRLNTSLSFTHK